MTNSITNFVNSGYARNILNDLLRDGVKPDDIDIGYDTIDGPAGAHDHVVNDMEIIGYLYEHWTKYQSVLKEKTPFIVPWTLDDGDPQDRFQKLVMRNVRHLVEKARKAAAKKGLKAGGADYVTTVAREIYKKVLADPFFFKKTSPLDMKCDDTSETGVIIDVPAEASALEFLKTHLGSCTEKAKVMLAIFTYAGIPVRPVWVLMDDKDNWISHAAVQIEVKQDKWITIDTSMRIFDPQYKLLKPLTMAQFASVHYISSFLDSNDNEAGRKGAFLSQQITGTMYSPYLFHEAGLKEGLRILQNHFSGPEDPRPDILYLKEVKSVNGESAYRTALEDVLSRNPKITARLLAELIRELENYNPVTSFYVEAAQDLARTPKEKSDAAYAAAMHEIQTNKPEKARTRAISMIESDSSDETFMRAAGLIEFAGNRDDKFEIAKRWVAINPDNAVARRIMMQFDFENGNYDEVIRRGEILAIENNLRTCSASYLSLAYAKKGDIGKAVKTFDECMAAKTGNKNDEDFKKLFAMTRIFLALAAGDARGFHRRLAKNPLRNQCKAARNTYGKRGYTEFYREHAEAIDLFLRGNKKAALAKKAELLAEPDGAKAMKHFLDTFDFLPKNAIEWLREGIS